MKQPIQLLFLFFFLNPLGMKAQSLVGRVLSDSSHHLWLNEVTIVGKQKTSNQQLLQFFKSNQSSTLEDILARLPEISLVRRGSYGMEPTIRGFSAGQVNLMIDGMRIHGACTDKMDPASIYIEPVNLSQVQLQTASQGIASGSTVGGTLNLKLAEASCHETNRFKGLFSQGYQSAAKAITSTAQLNWSGERWALLVSGTFRNSENYKAGGGEIIPFSAYRKLNFQIAGTFLTHHGKEWHGLLLADEGWNIGYPALPMDVGYASARIASISQVQNEVSNFWQHREIKIYANKIRHFMDDSRRPNIPMHMDMPGWSQTEGAYLEAERRTSNQARISIRTDLSTTLLKASMTMYETGQPPMYMLTWPDNRRWQGGLSVGWQKDLDSLNRIGFSVRGDLSLYRLVSQEARDHVSIFSSQTNGRNDLLKNASLQYSRKLHPKIRAGASLGLGERSPTSTELYGFYLFNANDGYDYIGKPALKTEHSFQADLNLQYSWQNNRFQLSIFRSALMQSIQPKPLGGFSTMTIGAKGVKTYENIPRAHLSGVEASIVVKPAANMDFISTLKYLSGKDYNNSPLANIHPLKNVSSLKYIIHQIGIRLEGEFAASQKQFNQNAGEDATAGYRLMHFRFDWKTQWKSNPIEIQSGVENIFDTRYHEHLDWGNIPRPGRNIYFLVKLNW